MSAFITNILPILVASIWQSAILLLVYSLLIRQLNHLRPTDKKNLLYGLIGLQVLLSAIGLFKPYNRGFDSTLNILANITVENQYIKYLLYWAYLAGVIYHLAKTALGIVGLHQLRLSSKLAPARFQLFAKQKCLQIGISSKILVAVSEKVRQPLTFGFWKPMIVLPVALLAQIDENQAEMIILHELAHIKSNDYLANFFILLVEAVYFFNPFLRQLIFSLKLEREKSCDDYINRFSYAPVKYAETLLIISRLYKHQTEAALGFVSKRKNLLERIKHITQYTDNQYFSKSYGKKLQNAALWLLFVVISVLLYPSLPSAKDATTVEKQLLVFNTNKQPEISNKFILTDEVAFQPEANNASIKLKKSKARVPEKHIKNNLAINKIVDNQINSTSLANQLMVPVVEKYSEKQQFIISEEEKGHKYYRIYNIDYDSLGHIRLSLQLEIEAKTDSILHSRADSLRLH